MLFERIKSLREENSYTKAQLADYLCVVQRTYSNYENGAVRVPTRILIKLADYYGTSMDYILGLTNETTPYEGGGGK